MDALPIDMNFAGSELGPEVAIAGPDGKPGNHAARGQTLHAGASTYTVNPTPKAVEDSKNGARSKAEQKLNPRVRGLAAHQRLQPGFYQQKLAHQKLENSQRVFANSQVPNQLSRKNRRQRNAYQGLDPNKTHQRALDPSMALKVVDRVKSDITLAEKIVSMTPEGMIANAVKGMVKKAVAHPRPARPASTSPVPGMGRRRFPQAVPT